MAEETIQDQVIEEPEEISQEDEFERLRRKSTLTSSVYDDMELDEKEESTNPLSRLSAAQTIILLLLLLIDVLAVSFLVYWLYTLYFA